MEAIDSLVQTLPGKPLACIFLSNACFAGEQDGGTVVRKYTLRGSLWTETQCYFVQPV